MQGNKSNRAIKCTVTQCTHHSKSENYCALDEIIVGTHEPNPTVIECTDCQSFDVEQYLDK